MTQINAANLQPHCRPHHDSNVGDI